MRENTDLDAAREKCRELMKLGVAPSQARSSLYASGCDDSVVKAVMEEYREMYTVRQGRRHGWTRLIGAAAFVAGVGAFAYYLNFASTTHHFIVYPYLGLALWGLLTIGFPGRTGI